MKVEHEISKVEWEKFLAESGLASSFFQSWNWGEFQKKLGNEVVRFGFVDDGKLCGVASGAIIRAKRGSYLYVRNGPVFDWRNHKESTNFVLEELMRVARQLGLSFVRISPLIFDTTDAATTISKYPVSPMADVDALDTWILDLSLPEDQIQANMRKSLRYEIRKAERDGVKISYSDDPSDIHKFYPVYLDTIKRNKWNGYSLEYIQKQFETFAADGQARIYFAEFEGEIIASSIFIYHGDSAYYHYSGSTTKHRTLHGTGLIHWHNILYAKERGLKNYNFWGIAPEGKPNHPWIGLTNFKMSFGGQAYRWLATRDLPVHKLKYFITNVYERLDKYRKGY